MTDVSKEKAMAGSQIQRIKRAIKRRLFPAQQAKTKEGREFYRPDPQGGLNPGFQSYYRENVDAIRQGIVPARYERIASIVPGTRVIEIGSADGTQSLTLARTGKAVCGVELMPLQFQEATSLRRHWLDRGIPVENCEFVNENILKNLGRLDGFDTVLMSRVLYHLRADIPALLDGIARSSVRNVVLVGCPLREARWRAKGEDGDDLGKYAYYASQEGMTDILQRHGFVVTHAESSADGEDPLVVGTRKVSA